MSHLQYAAPRRDGSAAIEDGRTPYYRDDPPEYDSHHHDDNDDDYSRSSHDSRRSRHSDRDYNGDDNDSYHSDFHDFDDHDNYNDNESAALRKKNDKNRRDRDRDNSDHSYNSKSNSNSNDYSDDEFETEGRAPEQAPTSSSNRRQHKYSTGSMPRRGNCRKYCCICLLFAMFLLISMGISMLFQHLFFGGDDDDASNQPDYGERNASETAFPKDKVFIDQVCSTGTMDIDRGARCTQACEPQFWACCNPFDERKVYNYTSLQQYANETNQTIPNLNEQDFLPVNATWLTDDPLLQDQIQNCSFGQDLRGCMSYAKCQATSGIIDSAPGTLPVLCGQSGLEQDAESCVDLCLRLECCFNELDEELSCIGSNLDICMDYAPCQNLRAHKGPNKLMTAPDDLDRACLWELPECYETCELAVECSNNASSFFQENFLTCLTYAPCTNVTGTATNISVPEMFNFVTPPPAELVYACHQVDDAIMEETPESCAQYCEQAACCYQDVQAGDGDGGNDNCFAQDPLGCWAWHQHCQTEPELRKSWFRTTYQEQQRAITPP